MLKRTRFPGKLIAVEGVDGSGKSTQIALLRDWLRGQGLPILFTEWNSSPVVKPITRRGKKKQALTPGTFSLLHAADLSARLESEIVPWLKGGGIVCADRYVYTAFARDAARGVDRSWVRDLYRFAPQPTLTLYFKTPLRTAMQRVLSGRQSFNYYEAGMDVGLSSNIRRSFRLFQTAIVEQYDRMAAEAGFVIIDATRPIELQQAEIRNLVADRLGLPYPVTEEIA